MNIIKEIIHMKIKIKTPVRFDLPTSMRSNKKLVTQIQLKTITNQIKKDLSLKPAPFQFRIMTNQMKKAS
jgi:hypothetical protein